ncbi:hypothetical protein Lesp01_48450 [Lentzea sp. NBRC 102530]|nr:hypothetical protein Lesp01_48450 [Lentzea sp. NBRC 102530]
MPRTVFTSGSSARVGVGSVGGSGADEGGNGGGMLGVVVAGASEDVLDGWLLDGPEPAGVCAAPHEARTTHSSTAADPRIRRHLR